MIVDKYLTYRGDISSHAVVGVGGVVAFTTVHSEGQATGLYRLDADKLSLGLDPLSKGGVALASEGEVLWVAGSDAQVYELTAPGIPPKPRGAKLAAAPTAIAVLAEGRLAVLVGSQVAVLLRKDGAPLQTLELPEPGTCLAVDPTGHWLAVGMSKGTVAVFDAEGKPEFLMSASERLHEGAVTALLFEPDELRVFSAGADQKLLSTHARGKLEPEDKGRGNNHTDIVTALIWGPGDRLYSGSRDGTIKSWPRVGGVKPATTRDGVGRVVALTLVHVHARPRLVAACDDGTLRFFPVDASGKIGELSHRVHDAYAHARHELSEDEPSRREAALEGLAVHGDARAIELISDQVGTDADHTLRLLAARSLARARHPRVTPLLEKWLGHPDEAVRVAAFVGLRERLGESDLRPIDLALKVEKADVGILAVRALEGLASRDDRALARLTDALNAKTPEVRQAALVALESAYDPESPEANLGALGTKHPDVRRSALVRLFRRRMLGDPAVQSALRRRAEDADPGVRRTAFLLSLHTRERLLEVLRSIDPELHRQLADLEGTASDEATPPANAKKGKPPKAPAPEESLEDADLEPLLQASASRALDTCLRGARGLALLGDPRAFGLLLQLSREGDESARAEVCRAMAALDDPRSIERLRSLLHDKEVEVRDAAFTALAHIEKADPLLAAESGLNASHEDVRRRGLQVLIAEVRKAPPKWPADASWGLLARALNDSFPSVRAEAFKSVLGQQLAGGGAGTLRFAMRSVHPDIRREVLTEAMAQVGEAWGWEVLLEFFDDPDPKLRDDAFGFAIKKTKGLEFLEAGLGSRHPDLRKRSVDELIKKHTAAAQALLIRALDDEDRDVRLGALGSLIDSDALPTLAGALGSPHADVLVRAARALARHGDRRALDPLLDLATAPEPIERERQADWLGLAESALDGLAELGDPAALADLIPLLDSPHAPLRKQAARAVVWSSRHDTLDTLRLALPHDDPQVKYHAALGLACAGDASVASLVFSDAANKVLTPDEQTAAALALGASGEDRLVIALDDAKDEVRSRALLLLMIREWKDPQGTAARCLACLSSRVPRLRLTAALALESIADPAALGAFVVGLVNDRGDKPDWKVPASTVDVLAELLVHGDPLLRARSALLLHHLDAKEQAAFDQAWSVHKARYAAEIAALRGRAQGSTPVPLQDGPEPLRELAFGAYVGLVREQAGPKRKGQAAADPEATRVSQAALGRILALAREDPHHAGAARPVFMQALTDPNQAVRSQAFEHLQALGMDPTALGAEALATGHTDLGIKGLELLTGGASDVEGQAVLERTMLARKDDLAIEAAKLLIARRGATAVAGRALEAAHEPLRRQAISWLSAEIETDPAARDHLHRALGSRYQAIREAAALELATKKDPAAFDSLVGLLMAAGDPNPQHRVIEGLVTLGDPRAAGAFLDRLEGDPSGTALADRLLAAVGRFRRPEVVDRLLVLMDKDRNRRTAAVGSLIAISGYDQSISDFEEESVDRTREEKQFPRHDGVLARLMDRLSAPADSRLLLPLLPGARWSRGKDVDPVLAGLVNHPDETVRQKAVEALGWRLRKREGDPEPLRKVLQHKDPITQFLAAEGLAKAGRADGLNVLLASIDFAGDLDLRRRAVLALGELADERALDVLLRLAGEDGHALQYAAAQAIGHLGRSPRAEEIFKLLERFAKGDSGVAFCALLGLRWLDTRAGWGLIRQRAASPTSTFRDTCVELMGHDDDPATRDLLLRLLAGDVIYEVLEAALVSARRLWGSESLQPDYAVIQNQMAHDLDDFDETLDRVRDRGEPRLLFEILPKCSDEVRESLAISLVNRPEPPIAEARSALESPDPITAGTAARILGRAGTAAADAGEVLEATLMRWRQTWEEKRPAFPMDSSDETNPSHALTSCLRSLVWASGRLGVAPERLTDMAVARPDDSRYQPVRLEAVLALASGEMTPDVVAALETAALGGDFEIRAMAAQALGRRAPDRAAAMADRLLSDRVSFHRLALGDGDVPQGTLETAARQVHYQGVVLPELIDRGDVEALAVVAEDRSLPETTRLGAVEGLAAMARGSAEEVLRRIASDAEVDEELRKAAWRAIRRSGRLRRKAGVANAEVMP